VPAAPSSITIVHKHHVNPTGAFAALAISGAENGKMALMERMGSKYTEAQIETQRCICIQAYDNVSKGASVIMPEVEEAELVEEEDGEEEEETGKKARID
jgi:hypothetical protein